ncbi:Uncharacterised protein [Chlamydia trachomatis]|nr:Uncharacterised protein [Chlamydia trachomatis]
MMHLRSLPKEVKLVIRPHLAWHGDRDALPFGRMRDWLQLVAHLRERHIHYARRRSDDQDTISQRQLATLDLHLGNPNLAKVLDNVRHVLLLPHSTGACKRCPLAQALTEIVTIPKASVEDLS